MATADTRASDLLGRDIDPLRYDYVNPDPDEVLGQLARAIPRGSRILDVGCGTGANLAYLRDRLDCQVVGVEPDAKRAEACLTSGLEVVVGELSLVLLPSLGQFDVVIFADVLEHTMNPVEVLRTAAPFLKPAGFVIASVPNVAHWTVRLRLLLGRFEYQVWGIMDATHITWFTAASLHRCFVRAGYRVLFTKATPGLLMDEYRTRRPLRWLPRGFRDEIVRWLTRAIPTLFGCQHVVKAVPIAVDRT